MIYTSEIPIYLRVSLVPKRYLYSFFKAWKCSKDRLLIYLFNMNVVNIISNYILVLIYISFLIIIWNFFIFFLDIYFRFLTSYIISISINKGLKCLVKLVFYRI